MTQTILYTVATPTPNLNSFVQKNYSNAHWINDSNKSKGTIYSLAKHEEINQDANQLIKKELTKVMHQNCDEVSALPCFVLLPEPDSCFYHLAWLNKILQKFPNQQITCLVQDCRTYYFLDKTFKDNPNIMVVYFKKNIQELIFLRVPKLLGCFSFFSLTVIRGIVAWIIHRFKKPVKISKGGRLFFCPAEYAFRYQDGDYMDRILVDLYQQIKSDNPSIIIADILGRFSFLKWVSFFQFITMIIFSVFKWFKMFRLMDSRYKYYVIIFLPALIWQFALKMIIKQYAFSKIIYHNEVYIFGRLVALACRDSNIETIGFQHAMVAKPHPTYTFFNFYKDYPQLFPQKMLVYGSVIANLLAERGYPSNQLYKIGCKRIYNSIKTDSNNLKKQKEYDVLYLSPGDMVELQQVLPTFVSKRIIIRQHPNYFPVFMFEDMDVTTFKEECPNIDVQNSREETLGDSVQSVDVVFSLSPTTAFFDGILAKKVCVLFTTKELGDFYDLGQWDVQVVTDLKDVDWTKRADPTALIDELRPREYVL
jgi:hypothetical protein